jgi:ribosomal protein L37E
MGSNKKTRRRCPVCGEDKEFRADQEACSMKCGYRLRSQRYQDGAAASPDESPVERIARESEADRLKRENSAMERALREATARADIFTRAAAERVEIPEWCRGPKSGGARKSVACAFLSDAHFDERVDPKQINFVNEYDRGIAERRLRAFFVNTVDLAKDHIAGKDYAGIVLPIGGDMFSGNIHAELRETNEASIVASILHWLAPMEAGIRLFAEEFGKVFVPVVVGNHPRLSQKPVHKGRVQDNFDYLLAKLMERDLAGDKRITFAVSESPDQWFSVLGTRFQLTHGDQFRGGSGIAGALSPMMIGDARKRKRAQAIHRSYDYLLLGHWHQLNLGMKNVVMNGSLKGYDEYAFNSNFDFEPPQQAFWIVDPAYGMTIRAPIHCRDKAERYPVARMKDAEVFRAVA